MAKRDATPEQLEKLRTIRREFGKTVSGTYRVDERTGIMRVEVSCRAGLWHWWFDPSGRMVDTALHRQLPVDGGSETVTTDG